MAVGGDIAHAHLGGRSANDFLARYWQQQPLLVRGAFAEYSLGQSLVSGDELAGLALEAEVESRLVTKDQYQSAWQLRHGPFAEADFSTLAEQNWTLLVQALDLWLPEVATLLDGFDFIPRWRIDDVMASYAVPGGSVGPHFDAYDVFLLQLEGERQWHVGEMCDHTTPLQADSELSILANFEARDTWLLEPGDMLYLPPGLAHWGVAKSHGITLSVGFRSPALADMLGDLATELAVRPTQAHYQDPPLHQGLASADIDAAFVRQVQLQLREVIDDQTLLADWFARYMTAPKYPELVEVTGEVRTAHWQGASYRNGERSDST